MFRIQRFLIAILIFCSAGSLSAEVFSVDGISVDVEADNAVTARAEALRQGQKDAAEELFRRLTAERYYNRLPSVSEEAAERMVESLGVDDEKLSANRYAATLNVAFSGAKVQEFLRGRDLPIVTRRSEPVLIIPAIRSGQDIRLFSDPNQFASAFSKVAGRSGLLNIRLPLGDVADFAVINSATASDFSQALSQLMSKYGVSQGLILAASEPDASGLVEIRNIAKEGWDYEGLIRSATLSDPSSPDAWTGIVKDYVIALENQWKEDHLVWFDRVEAIPVLVQVSSLSEWASIQQALNQTNAIRNLKYQSMSQRELSIVIDYVGGSEHLRQSLDQAGLRIEKSGGSWTLSRSAIRSYRP